MKYISIFGFTVGLLFIINYKLFSTPKNPKKNHASYSIHQFKMTDIDDQPFDFSNLEGKAILLVNVASKCGFTSQYEGLQQLHNAFEPKGLVVIGVPSNDFGNQEPGSAQEIKSFCKMNFNVSFPLLKKSIVTGVDAIDLYQFLTDKSIHPKTGGRITWNFNKFLIDQKGHVVKRYSSFTKPMSKQLVSDVTSILNAKGDTDEKK